MSKTEYLNIRQTKFFYGEYLSPLETSGPHCSPMVEVNVKSSCTFYIQLTLLG